MNFPSGHHLRVCRDALALWSALMAVLAVVGMNLARLAAYSLVRNPLTTLGNGLLLLVAGLQRQPPNSN